jgi:cyclohexa-1,5-dienecarbonyl-CoA hydratase
MSEFKFVKTDKSPGRFDIILNNPPVNILTIAMMEEITAALGEAARDHSLKALVFRSEGKHFSVGADVAEHTADKVERMIEAFGGMFRALAGVPAVIIAAVDGSALGGGCELATFCDIVLASDRAKFGQPEIQLGVFPPVAAAVFPRLIGRNKAIELLITGKIIAASEALELGLINHVWPAEEFSTKANEFINSITSLSAAAIAITKKAIVQSLDQPLPGALRLADEIYLRELMATQDAHEGLKAFLEKRKPVWKDK